MASGSQALLIGPRSRRRYTARFENILLDPRQADLKRGVGSRMNPRTWARSSTSPGGLFTRWTAGGNGGKPYGSIHLLASGSPLLDTRVERFKELFGT